MKFRQVEIIAPNKVEFVDYEVMNIELSLEMIVKIANSCRNGQTFNDRCIELVEKGILADVQNRKQENQI